jgi:hypothetical protein
MTSLSTWLRAATGSPRGGGLTRTPTPAGRRRTRKAELPGHAIPRPPTSFASAMELLPGQPG